LGHALAEQNQCAAAHAAHLCNCPHPLTAPIHSLEGAADGEGVPLRAHAHDLRLGRVAKGVGVQVAAGTHNSSTQANTLGPAFREYILQEMSLRVQVS
jgi:hypothetical protein